MTPSPSLWFIGTMYPPPSRKGVSVAPHDSPNQANSLLQAGVKVTPSGGKAAIQMSAHEPELPGLGSLSMESFHAPARGLPRQMGAGAKAQPVGVHVYTMYTPRSPGRINGRGWTSQNHFFWDISQPCLQRARAVHCN